MLASRSMKCLTETRSLGTQCLPAESGRISHARKLFDEMSHRDSVALNAMIASYSQLGLHQEALSLFWRMRTCDTRPDHSTLTATLSACAGDFELRLRTNIHVLVLVLGYQSYLPINNALIDMYGKCLNPSNATRVFDETHLRNEVTWCSLLFVHMKSCQFDIAYKVFSIMPSRVEIAWNIMIAGHALQGEVELSSIWLHGTWFYIKSGWSSAVEAMNSLLSFYAEQGRAGDAIRVFESIVTPSQVSWNAIIDANMKVGDMNKAFQAFQWAPEKNIVSWTSMISGYARNGHGEPAVNFFIEMVRNRLRPDDFSFGAVIHACSSLAVLGTGKMLYGCIVHSGFNGYAYVGNGLINLYAKCGDIEGSNRAFREIPDKDLISWNAMLFAFGLHGKPNQALKFYKEMMMTGVKPDKVTFIGLLMTCSHSGLIEESHKFYKTMTSIHGLSPETDHVACMVDMLGRGGYIAEAKDLANKYLGTGTLDISSYESLLGACSAHQDWKEAEMVRQAMLEEGLKKMPG
ncbi:hypothetical protein TIFTF001_004124, partial [Ficus carica]